MKRRVCLSVLLLVFFTIYNSCSWFTSNDDNEISFTITGKLITNGAMPQNYDEAMNARTALATAPSGKTIQYKVLLLAAEGDTEPVEGAVSEVASDGSSYSIKYTGSSDVEIQYYLRAVAYYMDGTNEVDVLLSPDTPLQNAINLRQGSFSKDLEMRPATSGYGEVSLTITLDSATMCDSVTISDVTHFQITKSDSSVTISHKATSAENLKVASGSYPVTVNFYKTVSGLSTPVLVYQFSDVINVFNNLITNVWVDNGNSPHLTTDDSGNCSCNITEVMLEDFKTTNFYVEPVEGIPVVEGSGTFLDPFKSVKAAIDYVNAIGENSKTYTIHIKSDDTGAKSETFPSSVVITKKINLETYASIPGAKDGIFRLSTSMSFVFIINSNGYLSIKSNGQAAVRNTFTNEDYPLGATKGIMFTANYAVQITYGKFEMEGGNIECWGGGVWITSPATGKNCIFEMSGGHISGTSLEGSVGGVYVESGAIFNIKGKPNISGGTKGVVLESGQKINVTGPLKEGALIGVTAETEPTITGPVTITTGYGYQTGGYNAGVKPGRYFRGDAYGVTEDSMLESPAGEAVLAVSGGSLSTKIKDDITIEIDHTNASKSDKVFTFKVIKNKGLTDTNAPEEDITSATGINYSYTLKDHTDVIAQSGNYTKNKNTLTLGDTIPQGRYTLNVSVNYQGKNYSSSYDITYVDVTAPEGCVAVLGDSWNSAATLCADDEQRKSDFFIAGRRLEIPTLIASDHEVTQTEFERYMTYGSGSKPTQAAGEKDTYPVYWINWYSAMIYCNLLTLNDSTFGSTTDERLEHCVYSINGKKNPDDWINTYTSFSIYKNNENKFYCTNSEINSMYDAVDFNMNADGWRLPLDVEWEYLARGGSLISENQTIYSGSDNVDEVAWWAGNSGDNETSVNTRLHQIKTRKPNSLNLYDMCGNLSEWCQDWSLWDGSQNTGIQVDTPITGLTRSGAGTIRKSVRGSCWPSDRMEINYHLPSKVFEKYENIGFRVVRTVLE